MAERNSQLKSASKTSKKTGAKATKSSANAMVKKPEDYFRKWVPSRQELLSDLETEAEKEEIPIVGPVVGTLLRILVKLSGARRVLEMGTATGYSTLFMAEGITSVHGRIITLEQDEKMAARAEANFEKAGLTHMIEVVRGDAVDKLSSLLPPFDLAFMDIDKDQYPHALPFCKHLLRPGGLLVADNTAFADADRFNRDIAADPDWESVNLYCFLPFHSPEHDGICLALRQ